MNKLSWKSPPVLLAIYVLLASIVSYINAYEPDVWIFEVWVGYVAVALLLLTYRRFRFSNLVYILVALHFAVLAIGAHYTYAKMPLFEWLKQVFDLSRNHFDRVGHFMQGFVPVIITREILLRLTKLRSGKMEKFLSAAVPLAFSALWEILEMAFVLLFYANVGAEWLGMQGDVFDAQWDMTLCLIGAVVALVLLSRLHNRSMAKVSA